MKIRKGDKVQVKIGKDRGKTGTVEKVFNKEMKVLVSGLNIYKRHLKPRGEGKQKTGGIIDISRPLSVSKVGLICPKCQQLIRVGFKNDNKQKIRYCRKCLAEI